MLKHFNRFVLGALAFIALSFVAVAPAQATMKLSQTGGGTMISALGALSNSGTLKIYCGTQPTNPDTALSGNTLAATFTFNSTAFGSASLVSTKMQISGSFSSTTVTGAASCTATFARMYESDGTTVLSDWTVGTSGADININSTAITSGGNVTLSSFHENEPVD